MHRVENYWKDVANCFSGVGHPNILEFKVKATADLNTLKTPSHEQVSMLLNWTTAQAHDLLKPAVASRQVTTPKEVFDLLKESFGNKFSLMSNILHRHLSLESIVTEQRYIDRGWDRAQACTRRDQLYREHYLLLQEASRLLENERQEQTLYFSNLYNESQASEMFADMIDGRVAVLLSAEYLSTLYMCHLYPP